MTAPYAVSRGLARAITALLAACTIALILGTGSAHASTANTALINGDSVTTEDGITREGNPVSLEQWAAENAGFKVTVVSGSEWDAMSAEQFAQYQVLIVGDPICSSTPESATSNAAVWTSVVMGKAGFGTTVGNRTVVGTDPEDHYLFGSGGAPPRVAGEPQTAGAEHLVQDGIAFAGSLPGATGAYFDTSCDDNGSDVSTLNMLKTGGGEWEEASTRPSCGANVSQIASNPVFRTGPTALTDEDIEGWECSAHVSFTSFPTDWTALAITLPEPEEERPAPICGNDIETKEGKCGQAYVLVAGVGVSATSPDISLSPPNGADAIGGNHTVTATVEEVESGSSKRIPAKGVAVSFAVSGGPNAGASGECTTGGGKADPECKTDENGQVEFTYADKNGAGIDTISASAVLNATLQHANAEEEWINGTGLTLAPGSHTDPAGGSHTVVATAMEEVHEPLPGVRPAVAPKTRPAETVVKFEVTGQNEGASGECTTEGGKPDPECKTDEHGQVEFTYKDGKGAGLDTITASAEILETTYTAHAQERWLAPPPVEPEPPAKTATTTTTTTTTTQLQSQSAPTGGVLGFGAAHLASGSRACVASNGYLASVSGKAIASVTYTLDGHKLKTLSKANSHGAFTLRVHVASGHAHHLSIKVTFTSASHTSAVTLHKTLARCAAVHHVVAPRFTG
jgi:hypothetical protein